MSRQKTRTRASKLMTKTAAARIEKAEARGNDGQTQKAKDSFASRAKRVVAQREKSE